MIVSDKYRFCFIHIPKTGGSTVTWRLRKVINNPANIDIENITVERGWQGKFHENGQHSNYKQNMWTLLRKRQYFLFAFVRNPWSLMFSWYTSVNVNAHVEPSREGFIDFVEHIPANYSNYISKTQSSYLKNIVGHIAVKNVFKYENFEKDFEYIINHLELPATDIDLTDMNISNRSRDYHEYYDATTIDKVARHYKEDITNFGYVF